MKFNVLAHPVFLLVWSKLEKKTKHKPQNVKSRGRTRYQWFWKYLNVPILHFTGGGRREVWKLLIISLLVIVKHSIIQILFWDGYVLPLLYFLRCFAPSPFWKLLRDLYSVLFVLRTIVPRAWPTNKFGSSSQKILWWWDVWKYVLGAKYFTEGKVD